MASGISTSIFLRLFAFAPRMVSFLPLPLRIFPIGLISSAPERYRPVNDLSDLITRSGVPAAIMTPPYSPAPGPMSIR